LCELLHIPSDILPLIITRPLSGGASIATYEDIISRCGVDSYEAICASIIMASSDTVFYVIGIYFSSVGIKKTRWALPCALFVSGICIFISCAISRFFF
jgi:spore maturation protein B